MSALSRPQVVTELLLEAAAHLGASDRVGSDALRGTVLEFAARLVAAGRVTIGAKTLAEVLTYLSEIVPGDAGDAPQ
eukprot:2706752-Pyramimonas_sp.AAC.1